MSSVRSAKRAARLANGPKRLDRLRRLRKLGAARWIIKTEQVALVLNREGIRYTGIFGRMSKRQEELHVRHVIPAHDALVAQLDAEDKAHV